MHRAPPVLIALMKYTFWDHLVIFLGIPAEAVHMSIGVYAQKRDKYVLELLVYTPINRDYHLICLVCFFLPTWWPAWYLVQSLRLLWYTIYCLPLESSLCIFPLGVYINLLFHPIHQISAQFLQTWTSLHNVHKVKMLARPGLSTLSKISGHWQGM